MENLGYLLALGTALAWGSYMVPFKKSKSANLIQFQALMAVGIGLSGLIFSLVLGYSLNLNLFGLISGMLWAAANAIFLTAIINLGLARAVPISSSLVIISSFLWGLLFGEELQGMSTGFLGIGLITTGVILISALGSSVAQNKRKGIIAAVSAGLIWGSQLMPLKAGHVSTADFFFSVCIGILISAIALFLFKKSAFKKEAVWESFLSGFIWNIGNLLSLISLSLIGLSKMSPTSQSSTLVAVLWGLIYFKEVKNSRAKIQILVGAVILFIGIVTLGLA